MPKLLKRVAWVSVSQSQADAFIQYYPRNLHKDVCQISEPPLVSWNDFTRVDWPKSMVVQCKNGAWYIRASAMTGHYDRAKPIKAEYRIGAIVVGDETHTDETLYGSQYHTHNAVLGDQNHTGCYIKHDQVTDYQFVGNNEYARNKKVFNDQHLERSWVGGKIYILGLVQGDPELQTQLDEFYNTEQSEYTWASFYRWARGR